MSNVTTLSVSGSLESKLKNIVQVRDLPPFIVDEPERLGGSNAGANPLEYFLGALSACTSIMIAYVAKEQDFSYRGIDYETDGTLDPRGFKGVEGVQTYFQAVTVEVILDTDEEDEAIRRLKETVEKRCPLWNLLKDAGVTLKGEWKKK